MALTNVGKAFSDGCPCMFFVLAMSAGLNWQIIPEIDRHKPNQKLDANEGLQNGLILLLLAIGNVLDVYRILVKMKTGPLSQARCGCLRIRAFRR